MPIFQDGETPYNEMGARSSTQTRPVQRWEDVPVAITYKALDTPSPARLGFLDGTGWSRWTASTQLDARDQSRLRHLRFHASVSWGSGRVRRE